MAASFTPYFGCDTPNTERAGDAYIRVRVADAPRSDGSVLVYLPDGTAFVVNGHELLRFAPDRARRTND